MVQNRIELKRLFALITFVVCTSWVVQAQQDYTPAKPGKLDGVEIAYKVIPVHFYNPNGAQCVVMRFVNSTSETKYIVVECEVSQLTGMMQTEEFRGTIEVPAMKKRKGRWNGLVYRPTLFEHGKDLDFEIEFNFKEDHK